MRLPLLLSSSLVAALFVAPVATAASASPHTSALPAYGATWTADTTANSLTEYAASASGAATPIATISGASTGLSGPTAVAVGPSGNIFVANSLADSITEYAAGSSGNVAPTATIAGSATGLKAPSSLFIEGGQVWVTDPAANLVEAFSAGSTGNELPAETLAGPKTRLNHPIAVIVDNDFGFLTVLNAPSSGAASITTYFAPDRYGDLAPQARVLGAKGHPFVAPTAMAAAPDGFGQVWVADRGTNSVSELFTLGIGVPPQAVLTGAKAHLDAPDALSVAANGGLVVANGGDHSVRVFSPNARGDVAPVRSVTAVGSGAGSPASVSVLGAAPSAPIDVHAVAHNGRATVTWKPPASTGGGIIGYEVDTISRVSLSGPGVLGGITVVIGESSGPLTTKTHHTIHHLQNGRKYSFQIRAINAFGGSPSGRSNKVVPLTVPTAPVNVIAIGTDRSLAVGWTKPKQDGGRHVTHYRVEYATCSPGALTCSFRTKVLAAKHRRVRIHGLAAHTTYHVRVVAQNAVGNGHPSRVVLATTT